MLKLYKLLIAVGALGFVLYFFMGGAAERAVRWEARLHRKDGYTKRDYKIKKPHVRRHGAFVLLMLVLCYAIKRPVPGYPLWN